MAENNDIEFDDNDLIQLDDDLEGGFEAPPVKNDRNPVSVVAGKFRDGVREQILDPQFQRKFINDALPSGYVRAYDAARDGIETATDLYQHGKQELTNVINETKRVVRDTLPIVSKKLPTEWSERLQRWTDTGDGGPSQPYDPEAAEMQGALASVFAKQQTTSATPTPIDAINLLDARVSNKLSDQQLDQLVQIRSGIDKLTSYQDQVTVQFQRKSLELQYKQYFVARKQLDVLEKHLSVTKLRLDEITKNTALPEAVKIHNSEILRQQLQENFIAKLTTPVNEWTSKLTGRIVNRVKGRMSDFARDVGGTVSSLSLLSEMGQGNPNGNQNQGPITGLAGLASHFLGGQAAGKLSERLGQYIHRNHADRPMVQHLSNLFNAGADDAPKLLNKMLRQGSGIGGLDSILQGIGVSDLATTRTNRVQSTMKNDIDKVAIFNLRTQKTITEVIPGWLSRIHQVLRVIQTGDDSIKPIAFSFDTGVFEERSVAEERIMKQFTDPRKKTSLQGRMRAIIDAIDPPDEQNPNGKLSPAAKVALGKYIRIMVRKGEAIDYAALASFQSPIEGAVKYEIANRVKEVFHFSDEHFMDYDPSNLLEQTKANYFHSSPERSKQLEKVREAVKKFERIATDPADEARKLHGLDFTSQEILKEKGLVLLQGSNHNFNDEEYDRQMYDDGRPIEPPPMPGSPPPGSPPPGSPPPDAPPGEPPANPPTDQGNPPNPDSGQPPSPPTDRENPDQPNPDRPRPPTPTPNQSDPLEKAKQLLRPIKPSYAQELENVNEENKSTVIVRLLTDFISNQITPHPKLTQAITLLARIAGTSAVSAATRRAKENREAANRSTGIPNPPPVTRRLNITQISPVTQPTPPIIRPGSNIPIQGQGAAFGLSGDSMVIRRLSQGIASLLGIRASSESEQPASPAPVTPVPVSNRLSGLRQLGADLLNVQNGNVPRVQDRQRQAFQEMLLREGYATPDGQLISPQERDRNQLAQLGNSAPKRPSLISRMLSRLPRQRGGSRPKYAIPTLDKNMGTTDQLLIHLMNLIDVQVSEPLYQLVNGPKRKGIVGKGSGLIGGIAGGIGRGFVSSWRGGKYLLGRTASAGAQLVGYGARSVGDAAKWTVGAKKPLDISLKSNPETPLILGKDIRRGMYRDLNTGKIIKGIEDITGPVIDQWGNQQISQEDIDNGIIDVKGKSPLRKALGGLWRVHRAIPNPLKVVGAVVMSPFRATKWLLSRPKDVYVEGEQTPRLIARLMEAGAYSNKATGKVIKTPSDILGEVIDQDGNVVIRAEELPNIRDAYGNKFKSISYRLFRLATAPIRAVGRLAKGAWDVGMKVNSAVWEAMKWAAGGATNFFKNGISGLFEGRGKGKKKTDEHLDVLKEIRTLLDTRLPQMKKSKYFDRDGDGIRENSAEDQKRKKEKGKEQPVKEKGKEEPKEKSKKGGFNLKGLLGGVGKGRMGLGLGALGLGGAGALLGGLMGGPEETDEEGNPIPGSGSALTGALIGGAAGAALPLAAKGIGLTGRGLWWGAKNTVTTALPWLARTALPWVARGAVGLLAGLVSAPVLLAGAAVAAVAYGGYALYKKLKKDAAHVTRYRMAQYGVDIEDSDKVSTILELEKKCETMVSVQRNKGAVLQGSTSIEEIAKLFEVELEDQKKGQAFAIWFQQRFKPVYLSHVTVMHRIRGVKDISSPDDMLTRSQKLELVQATHFFEARATNPYNILETPFKDAEPLKIDYHKVVEVYDVALDSIKQLKDDKVATVRTQDMRKEQEVKRVEAKQAEALKLKKVDAVTQTTKQATENKMSAWQSIADYAKATGKSISEAAMTIGQKVKQFGAEAVKNTTALLNQLSPMAKIGVLASGPIGTAVAAGMGVVQAITGGGQASDNNIVATNGKTVTVRLNEQDIVDIIKVATTEVIAGLKGDPFEKQCAGVIDTIVNRVASGRWGKSVRSVVNAHRQFSKITGPASLSPYGSVERMPDSAINPKVNSFGREWLKRRSAGTPSSVGGHLNYANPYYSDAHNRRKWVDAFFEVSRRLGLVFGVGKAVHGHGTVDELKKYMPGNVIIQLVGNAVSGVVNAVSNTNGTKTTNAGATKASKPAKPVKRVSTITLGKNDAKDAKTAYNKTLELIKNGKAKGNLVEVVADPANKPVYEAVQRAAKEGGATVGKGSAARAYQESTLSANDKVETPSKVNASTGGRVNGGKGFNVNTFCQTLSKNAGHRNKSLGKCATYVRIALDAAGANTVGHPIAAADYSKVLMVNGYRAIDINSHPQAGDICVWNRGPRSKKYGHICGYTGNVWISDFIQSGMDVYGGQHTGTLYRYMGPNQNTIPGGVIKASDQSPVTGTARGNAPWLKIAEALVGVNEASNATQIAEFHELGGGGKAGASVSWCASFIGYCLEKVGVPGLKSKSSRAYEKYGEEVNKSQPIPVGAIGVIARGNGSGTGHVFFIIADNGNTISTIEGNFSNSVKRHTRKKSELLSVRWPTGVPVTSSQGTNTTGTGWGTNNVSVLGWRAGNKSSAGFAKPAPERSVMNQTPTQKTDQVSTTNTPTTTPTGPSTTLLDSSPVKESVNIHTGILEPAMSGRPNTRPSVRTEDLMQRADRPEQHEVDRNVQLVSQRQAQQREQIQKESQLATSILEQQLRVQEEMNDSLKQLVKVGVQVKSDDAKTPTTPKAEKPAPTKPPVLNGAKLSKYPASVKIPRT